MNLAFLLPAAFAALAALLVPLLLHLARRSEQKPTTFAALRWLRHKPKPRHRIRFDEWPLLALRLLLLALLAVWLARPVLSGSESDAPWVAVVPGAPPQQARAQAADGARLRWLAPGFPSLDEPAPAATAPVGSLLRELDAELPRGVALTVVAPTLLQGADAEQPVLSRTVRWQVADGAMPAPVAAAPDRFAPVLRHAQDEEEGVRYLRAALAAWAPDGAPAAPDAAGVDQPIPGKASRLIWLASGRLPQSVQDWTRKGGTVLLAARATLPSPLPMTPVWRDAQGGALVESAPFGRGRVLRFTRALQPAAMPALLEADFPRRLHDLFVDPPAPTRVAAIDYAPLAGAAPYIAAPRDLQPWLALLIAALVLAERWLATRRKRNVSP